MNRKVLIRWMIIAVGTGVMLLAMFAYQLGLDNDPGWGTSRFLILGCGVAVVFFGALYWITPVMFRWFENSVAPALANLPVAQGVKRFVQKMNISSSNLNANSKWFAWLQKNSTDLVLLLIAIFVVWSYLWVVTIGRMDKWPPDRQYYWMLTQAFQSGQTSLLIEPKPEILQLKNPYDLDERKGLDYPWDITLYNGKYYLYWGPVPAVLGFVVNLVTSKPVGDGGLVFSFVLGTALFSVLLLRKLYQDGWFPCWVFWGGVLASVLNMPLVWLLTHPAYYEASIAGGQFFIMTGFFLLYLAFRSSSVHKGYILLATLAFGLAGGTRISLLPSVVFLGLVALWQTLARLHWNIRKAVSTLTFVILPLLVVAISLSLYNYARFSSIFEFGHRYQLTGLASTENYDDQISVHYIVPSFYSYVFRPPAISSEFPFVTLPAIKESMWPFFIQPPANYYYAEPLAGILFTVPLIGFTFLLFLRLLWLWVNGDVSLMKTILSDGASHNWFWTSQLGYALIQTYLLLIFVSTSMRYQFDISSVWIVLATIFIGVHVRSFEEKRSSVNAIVLFWVLGAVLTVVTGLLIGITGGQNNFLNKNPSLYNHLLEWFSR